MTTWKPTLLRAGRFRLDAGSMFGILPRTLWSKWFPKSGPLAVDELNRMPLQQNSILLESDDGRLVVIETGIGDKLTPREQEQFDQEQQGSSGPRALHHALDEIGCDPKDVAGVVITHMHFDHAAGLTRLGPSGDPESPVLTLPNAEIFLQRQEIDDALANRSTMHKTYLPSHLTPEARERFHPVQGEQEILPGLIAMATPGHTWGHQAVRFESSTGGTMCFTGDLIPTHRHARPTTNMAFDVEPYTSMIERQRLLERAMKEGWTLLLPHEPEGAALTLEPSEISEQLEARQKVC